MAADEVALSVVGASDWVVVRAAMNQYAVQPVAQGGRAGDVDADEIALDEVVMRGRREYDAGRIDVDAIAQVAGDHVADIGDRPADDAAGSRSDFSERAGRS